VHGGRVDANPVQDNLRRLPVFDAEGVGEHATELGVVETGVDDREVALALEDAVAVRQDEVPPVVPPVQDSTDRVPGDPGIQHEPGPGPEREVLVACVEREELPLPDGGLGDHGVVAPAPVCTAAASSTRMGTPTVQACRPSKLASSITSSTSSFVAPYARALRMCWRSPET